MTSRNLPNLYELRLDEDDDTEYDYCEDSKGGRHFNGKNSNLVRSLSMENTYSDDDLEKGDAGSPPYFGQSCLVIRHGGLDRNDDPSKHPHPSMPSSPPTQPSTVSARPPNPSPRQAVTIATSSLHVTTMPPTTLGQFKIWSVEAFEFAKQFVYEKIGKSQKTLDHELEKKVEMVRETQNQFRVLFDLARNLEHQYRQIVHTQKILSEVFVTLSHRNPEEGLCEQFNCNALTQRLLAKNGEALMGCLEVFLRSMSTLCNTTIEDTLATVKNLEKNRLKYDAYRSYVEKVRAAPRDHQYTLRLQEAERNFTKYQAKYGRLHYDLNIKLKFLEENKVKVCQKHLFLFHKGFLNYIAGNRQGIEDILHQFGGFPSSNSLSNPSTFLEAPLALAAHSAPNLTARSLDVTLGKGCTLEERSAHRRSADYHVANDDGAAVKENVKTRNEVESR